MSHNESLNSKQNWEPDELEFWELDDFVDVLQGKEVSNLEYEFNSNNNFR